MGIHRHNHGEVLETTASRRDGLGEYSCQDHGDVYTIGPYPATDVDIVLGDGEFPLFEHGIPGKIVHTPGHSMGSVSGLLETGEAFVGDLAMNMFPLRFGPGLPILAEDMQKVRQSWKLLMGAGAKTIYPAHGEPFSVDVIRRALL